MVLYVVMAVLIGIWTIWVVQAWLSAWQWRLFAGKFTHAPHNKKAVAQPKAAVIVPFKGIDLDLAQTLDSLCSLDYPDYELLLVVDAKDDPAYPLLLKELARHPHTQATILIAGQAGLHEGQKVHNQLYAIDHLLSRQSQPDAPAIWVFADSDAIPGPHWLASMTRPLFGRNVGMTTGYRWLVPVATTLTGRFWSSIASVINSSAIGFLRKERYNHAWGGSMALLAETAIRGDLKGYLAGALCDDYQFTRMVKAMGMRIVFVRSCLVATPVSFDAPGLVNFAHRQYLLTRVYAPDLYCKALTLVAFYNLANLSAWVALIVMLTKAPQAWYGWGLPAITIAHVALWNQIRASLRKTAIKRALGKPTLAQLNPTLRLDRWLTWFWMATHLALMLRALAGKTMCWRGIYYRLHGPQVVERMNRS